MAEMILIVDGRSVKVDVAPSSGGGTLAVRVDGREIRLGVERLGPTTWRVLEEDGTSRVVRSVTHRDTHWLHLDGDTLAVRIGDARARARAARGGEHAGTLEAPMPGAVTRVAVREGDVVAAGQPIVVVEAMKMEHVIRAPHAGRVMALRVREGERLDAGAVVAEIQPVAAPGGSGEPSVS